MSTHKQSTVAYASVLRCNGQGYSNRVEFGCRLLCSSIAVQVNFNKFMATALVIVAI